MLMRLLRIAGRSSTLEVFVAASFTGQPDAPSQTRTSAQGSARGKHPSHTRLSRHFDQPLCYGKHGGPEFGIWLAVGTQNEIDAPLRMAVGDPVTVTRKIETESVMLGLI